MVKKYQIKNNRRANQKSRPAFKKARKEEIAVVTRKINNNRKKYNSLKKK